MQQKRIAQPVVEIRNLHFSYGDLQVLRGLSLSIPRGEVVAILGGSGSGKSTLLKLIGGQLRPEQGTSKFSRIGNATFSYTERSLNSPEVWNIMPIRRRSS